MVSSSVIRVEFCMYFVTNMKSLTSVLVIIMNANSMVNIVI